MYWENREFLYKLKASIKCLQAYYQINRRTQLNNDLAANVNFAQQYETYIAQVVGYFVIEDRVARATDAMAGQV